MLKSVFEFYGMDYHSMHVQPFGSGLINRTWIAENKNGKYILQRINTAVFKNPKAIEHNIHLIGDFFARVHPQYLFASPVKTMSGDEMVFIENEGYFRMFPFIKNSHTIDVVQTTSQAYEAAKQFGKFTKLLSNFPVQDLQITLPDFHHLVLRYEQFLNATKTGNAERLNTSKREIEFLLQQQSLCTVAKNILSGSDFILRVTHHDTKISNVLFDGNDNGLCVIDLDTVMPGYFISDVGDMMRTYLSPVSEEEKDFSKIEIRNEYFKAIAEGYLSEMNDVLTSTEKQNFIYAGKCMIYMQALRFLTDYLNNDIYYGSKYEGHNFIRAQNQITLLKILMDKERELNKLC